MVSNEVSYPLRDSRIEELSERVERKSKQAFFEELNEIKSNILEAYEIHNDLKSKNQDWLLSRDFYESLCKALSIFADVTDWLHDVLLLSEARNKERKVKFEKAWIIAAKQIIDDLKELTFVYTTYDDSLGMGNGDLSISNLFLNLYSSSRDDRYDERPYFPENFRNAAEILCKNREFDLAYRYALMAAIDAIWDQYRYEKDDVVLALMTIPYKLEEQGMHDDSANYIAKTLEWLYKFYSEWEDQYDAPVYIHYLHYELISLWNKITNKAKKNVTQFWDRVIKIVIEEELVFNDFFLSDLVTVLVEFDRYKDAFEIVETGLTYTVTHAKNILDMKRLKLDDVLQNMLNLAKLGFSLKDRNVESLKKNVDIIKSYALENKVSELARYMGYTEYGDRVWRFKDPRLHEFMENKKTNTVEIDTHQWKIEYSSGKERKILFLAECKYTNKSATKKDVEFFLYKAKDLLKQLKADAKRYPEKLVPKIGEIWFVSIAGFDELPSKQIPRVDGSEVKLIDGYELNNRLKKKNLKKVPILLST